MEALLDGGFHFLIRVMIFTNWFISALLISFMKLT